MTRVADRPRPFVVPRYCKGCGRCIGSCIKDCFTLGTEVEPSTGLVPIVLDVDRCNGCGLCFDACPEPYCLWPEGDPQGEMLLHEDTLDPFAPIVPQPQPLPDRRIAVPEVAPLVMKGTYAAAVGALFAGCRHVYGYPITPSTEGAEMMAKVLPKLGGVFVQAVSEVATVNMMYGAGGAGRRCMTFTSSPGFSLMLEGISYMIGAEVPGVFVNVMRGGPGLGNIAPEQSDLKLACHGLGHGNTRAIALAPASPQEMLDLTMLAFDLAFRYRNPVVVLGDGYLGQISGKVRLPTEMVVPGVPEWAVFGDRSHRANLICSINLEEDDLERDNARLNDKYARMSEQEQRYDLYRCRDAEVLLVACNTPARLAKGAVRELRERGVTAGLFRPITVWPFPIVGLRALLGGARRLVVVEASAGQLEDEMRLALSHEGIDRPPPISHVRRSGGNLPSQDEIVEHVLSLEEVA
jgi:pyruvate/2-oxoacid:ferredoxin oxidoreductase alpha subunit/NAD-dependent dihydropyrimidine dehydrogenase PreA subunit